MATPLFRGIGRRMVEANDSQRGLASRMAGRGQTAAEFVCFPPTLPPTIRWSIRPAGARSAGCWRKIGSLMVDRGLHPPQPLRRPGGGGVGVAQGFPHGGGAAQDAVEGFPPRLPLRCRARVTPSSCSSCLPLGRRCRVEHPTSVDGARSGECTRPRPVTDWCRCRCF